MRYYLIIATILLSFTSQAQTPYDLSFPGLAAGQTIALSQYEGKKLLVVVVNAAAPDAIQLRMLDSLYRKDSSSLSVIAIPVDDFGAPMDDSLLYHDLKDSLALSYILAQTGKGAKAAEGEQHVLLQWLTHVEDNSHFDKDITEEGRAYLLSETGSLYGLFAKEVTSSELENAIQQTVTK